MSNRVLSRRGLLALLVVVPVAGVMTRPPPARATVAATVVENRHDPALDHNIPHLAVPLNGVQHDVDFLGFYDRNGELTRWGHPTSEVFEETPGTLTQYYQRGVVDWQPLSGGGYSLQRRLAWDFIGGGAGGAPDLGVEDGFTSSQPGEALGPWGHRVSNWSVEGTYTGFKEFFDGQGGVEAFGYPKTDARRDDHPQAVLAVPGSTPGFIRQYFQAAVLEFHEGESEEVKIGLIGDTLRDLKYANGAWEGLQPFQPAVPLEAGPTQIFTIAELVPTATPTATPIPTPLPPPSLTVVKGFGGTDDYHNWIANVATDFFDRALVHLGEPAYQRLTTNFGPRGPVSWRGAIELQIADAERRLLTTPLIEIAQAVWWSEFVTGVVDNFFWLTKGIVHRMSYKEGTNMGHLGYAALNEDQRHQVDIDQLGSDLQNGHPLVTKPLIKFTRAYVRDGTTPEYRVGIALGRYFVMKMERDWLGLEGMAQFHRVLPQEAVTSEGIRDVAANYVSADRRDEFIGWYNQRVFVGFAL